ncbi:hypothetical protein BGZ73_003927 [Actinomortierella ambigua]|nr:hypothetical protein BGZ73_003927 [Actinomortierella ambigua]
MSKRILALLPSTDTIGNIKKKTGWYAEELAEPATILANRGFEIVFASPKGGKAPLDEGSREAAEKNGIVKAFLENKEIQDKIAHSHKIAEFIGQEDSFQGLLIPGGHGAYDLEHNKDSIQIIQNFWEKGKVVGGICHGVVALNEVKLKDGTPLVKGKKVTGFSDAEEEIVGLTKEVPCLPESRLKELGAIYSKAPEPWGACVVSDGRLVTGQNPASARGFGDALYVAIQDHAHK